MTDLKALPDEQLVELCKKNNSSAWTVLLSRYTSVARKKASSFSARVDADDLVQEGLIGLFGAVRSYDCEKGVSFATYANVCIRNRMINAANFLKAKSSPGGKADDETDYVDTSMTPEELAVSKSEVEALQSLISKTLSEKECEVFTLYICGYTYASIAEKLGISPKSVDGALQRARAKLRAALG